MLADACGKHREHLGCELDRSLRYRIEQRQQRFREPRQVPLGRVRLVGIGVAAVAVDRAEDCRRVERIHEGARPEVDRFAANRHVVGIHYAVDEADVHPLCDEQGLALGDRRQQREIRLRGRACVGIVAIDDVVGEEPDGLAITARGEVLERADANVARGHPRQYGARDHSLAANTLTRRDGGERACSRNAERVHRLAHQVLPQNRSKRRPAVAVSGEWSTPRALQLYVAARPGAASHFAK